MVSLDLTNILAKDILQVCLSLISTQDTETSRCQRPVYLF